MKLLQDKAQGRMRGLNRLDKPAGALRSKNCPRISSTKLKKGKDNTKSNCLTSVSVKVRGQGPELIKARGNHAKGEEDKPILASTSRHYIKFLPLNYLTENYKSRALALMLYSDLILCLPVINMCITTVGIFHKVRICRVTTGRNALAGNYHRRMPVTRILGGVILPAISSEPGGTLHVIFFDKKRIKKEKKGKKGKKRKKKEKKMSLAGIEPQSSDYESRAKPTELLR